MSVRPNRSKRAEVRMRKKVVEDILKSVPDYIQKVKCDTSIWTKPFKCAVACCANIFEKPNPNYPYKFHNFPPNGAMRTLWLEKCNLDEDFDASRAKVCSDHFIPDDYERNFKEELTNPLFKRVLKNHAVPSQRLNGPALKIDGFFTTEFDYRKSDFFKDEVRKAVDINEVLENRLKELTNEKIECATLIRNLDILLTDKTQKFQFIKKKYEKYCKRNSSVPDRSSLLRVFSQSQINVLLGKRKVFWTNDDMAMAFTLRHMGGKQCYLYLKNVLNFPLPSLSSIQRWAASK